ncbi:uncharacterized protein J3D65DRAFT_668400 [Phyllosticta citribraziliensis]|uniref:Uncharacterized protein n=1 Tax=Phyllosticta citribraziliensis TaxID=989973 RepID=A0ABR1LMP6_9PEZI
MSAHDNQQKRGQAAGDQPPPSAPRAPRSMRGSAPYGQGPTGFEDMQYQLEYNRQQPMFGTGVNFGGLHDTTAHQAGQRPRAPAPRKASGAPSLHRKESHGPLDVTSGLGASAPSPYSLGAVAENSGDHTPEPKMSAHAEDAGKQEDGANVAAMPAIVGRPPAPSIRLGDDTVPFKERREAWKTFMSAESQAMTQWTNAGAPACAQCQQKHAPPCFKRRAFKKRTAFIEAGKKEIDGRDTPTCERCGHDDLLGGIKENCANQGSAAAASAAAE